MNTLTNNLLENLNPINTSLDGLELLRTKTFVMNSLNYAESMRNGVKWETAKYNLEEFIGDGILLGDINKEFEKAGKAFKSEDIRSAFYFHYHFLGKMQKVVGFIRGTIYAVSTKDDEWHLFSKGYGVDMADNDEVVIDSSYYNLIESENLTHKELGKCFY